MLLRRISQQGDESLEAAYTNFGGDDNPPFNQCGRMILALLQHLQTVPPHSSIWAHTSMNDIVLDDTDDYRTSFARIGAWDGVYQIFFRWTPPATPSYSDLLWANAQAMIVGRTTAVPKAAQMIASLIEQAPRTLLAPRAWLTTLLATPLSSISSEQRHPLRVVATQYTEALSAFYHALSQHAHPAQAQSGQRMRQLIEHFETTAIARDLWVYRENEGLVFVAQDAIVPGISVKPEGQGYTISYPWSHTLPAWEDACVECHTHDIIEAGRLIQAARDHI